MFAIHKCIKKNLGDQFMNPTLDSMEQVFKSTDFKTTLIFIINIEADSLLNIIVK